MSIDLLASHSLDLLTPSSNQALWSAMAFRRASGVRALGAPRARKLQPCTRAAASRPCLGPHFRTSPCTPRLATTRQPALAPYSATIRAPLVARWRHSRLLPWTAPPEPQPRPSSPLGSPSLSKSTSASPCRRHVVLQATERRFAVELIPGRRRTDLLAL